MVGDGGSLKNLGEKKLNLEVPGGEVIALTLQIAKVTRPLMSIGRIADEGFRVVFEHNEAEVIDKASGNVVCTFHRRNGGLYTCKMVLKAPFGRRG